MSFYLTRLLLFDDGKLEKFGKYWKHVFKLSTTFENILNCATYHAQFTGHIYKSRLVKQIIFYLIRL